MSLPNAWDELTLEDFPLGGLRTLAEHLGPHAATDVWRCLKGGRLDIPTGFTRSFKLRYIRDHYSGSNAGEIARHLNCTEKFVRDSLNATIKSAPIENRQLSLI